MIPMKADMAGGAAVIAVLGAMRELGIRHRVTAWWPRPRTCPPAPRIGRAM
jgi:leucyl aminopeptidase